MANPNRQTDVRDLLREALDKPVPNADLVRDRILAAIEPSAAGGSEIMTLAEVAVYLRLDANELGELAESLPAFELGGRVLVRKTRLVEWIEQRERQYSWATGQSAAAHSRHLSILKGVA